MEDANPIQQKGSKRRNFKHLGRPEAHQIFDKSLDKQLTTQ